MLRDNARSTKTRTLPLRTVIDIEADLASLTLAEGWMKQAALRLDQWAEETWVPIFMGYYEMSLGGRIRRAVTCRGTYSGRELRPYKPGGGRFSYVKLHGNGIVVQLQVENLMNQVFNSAHRYIH